MHTPSCQDCGFTEAEIKIMLDKDCNGVECRNTPLLRQQRTFESGIIPTEIVTLSNGKYMCWKCLDVSTTYHPKWANFGVTQKDLFNEVPLTLEYMDDVLGYKELYSDCTHLDYDGGLEAMKVCAECEHGRVFITRLRYTGMVTSMRADYVYKALLDGNISKLTILEEKYCLSGSRGLCVVTTTEHGEAWKKYDIFTNKLSEYEDLVLESQQTCYLKPAKQ